METASHRTDPALGAPASGVRAIRRALSAGVCLVVAAAALAAPASSAAEDRRIRKDVASLSKQERRDFVEAVVRLKRTPSPYGAQSYLPQYSGAQLSWYDQFVLWHLYLSRCDPQDVFLDRQQLGHGGPLFLPWHRQFLILFEDALREVSGKDVTVPYWDWTSTESTTEVFKTDFMGPGGNPQDGYAVTEGAFAAGRWRFTVVNEGLFWGASKTTHITRNRDGAIFPRPNAGDLLSKSRAYDAPPFDDSSDPAESFRNALEGWNKVAGDVGKEVVGSATNPSMLSCAPDGWINVPLRGSNHHNRAHVNVGGVLGTSETGVPVFGTLSAVPASPNDPVFFLVHSNVDRLWTEWQNRRGDVRPADAYAPFDDYKRVMQPFWYDGIRSTPQSVLRTEELGYRYAPPAAEQPASGQPASRRRRHRGADRRAAATRHPQGTSHALFCRHPR